MQIALALQCIRSHPEKSGVSHNRKKRAGRRVKRQREMWEGRRTLIRVGTLNIGTMTGRRIEPADMMERRSVDVLSLQETKWKGSKARNIGGGCKIFYNGAYGRRNGIVVREELVESVLEMKRVSDRLMAMKLEVKGSILNRVSAYAPHVNNSIGKKNNFWQDLDDRKCIKTGKDSSGYGLGHVGKGNIGNEKIMGRYGAGTRNKEGSMVVDFCEEDGFGDCHIIVFIFHNLHVLSKAFNERILFKKISNLITDF